MPTFDSTTQPRVGDYLVLTDPAIPPAPADPTTGTPIAGISSQDAVGNVTFTLTDTISSLSHVTGASANVKANNVVLVKRQRAYAIDESDPLHDVSSGVAVNPLSFTGTLPGAVPAWSDASIPRPLVRIYRRQG